MCLGVYGFKSHLEFIETFEHLKLNSQVQGEIFVSHIITYQIGVLHSHVHYIEASYYEDWGTLESWKKIMGKYSSYFLDLDGVLFVNTGKYGLKNWDNYFEPIHENILFLRELQESGAQLILTTSRPEKYRNQIESYFRDHGLNIHVLIMGLYHSPRIIVNDFASSNPYPSCRAINLPRNGVLRSYF